MSLFRKSLIILGILIIAFLLFSVVFKPVFLNFYISLAHKYTRGRFVCTLDNQGRHVARLYKINKGEETLIRKTISNSCIFSRPKINAGFFIFAIGGGGGATPYESGNSGQIISKHKKITNPVIVINIGKGGKGTHIVNDETNNTKFVDAKDGEDTTISEINIIAKGGSKSTRMTPLGAPPKIVEYHIPEKYHQLYDIPKSAKYGAGGAFNKYIKDTSAKAESGHSGAVIIQW